MQHELALYLRMTKEFGGTRFGPFEGVEIVLGSDSTRCDITIPESLGVFALHVKLLRQQDNSLILAPAERTATVYLWREQARQPIQIDTPTALRPNDSFALVTEDGPRFIVELDELPEALKKQREAAGGKRKLSAGALGDEAKRQFFSKLLASGPGNYVAKIIAFFKSGAFLRPRYIFLAVALLGGYVLAGGMSCRGSKLKRAMATESKKLESCEKNLGFAKDMNEPGRATFSEMAAEILEQSTNVGISLDTDAGLRDATWKACQTVLGQKKMYRWLVESRGAKANDFAEWREMLMDEEELAEELVTVLPYAAADPSRHFDVWQRREDSLRNKVCTRGITQLSYRQALHLGIKPQLDALIDQGKLASYGDDKSKRESALQVTLELAGEEGFPDAFTSTVQEFTSGQGGCVYVEGDDKRLEKSVILRRMVKHLGADSAYLPAETDDHAVMARIAKYYAADLPQLDFRKKNLEIDFTGMPVSTVTAGLGSEGEWVLQQTAYTLARSIVLPCLAVVSSKVSQEEAAATMGFLPPLVTCLMLEHKLLNDEQ